MPMFISRPVGDGFPGDPVAHLVPDSVQIHAPVPHLENVVLIESPGLFIAQFQINHIVFLIIVKRLHSDRYGV